jgi:hypothetical protein
MSYLRYLCLLTYSGVQHKLWWFFWVFFCWTPPYTRHKTKTNKTKNTTQYVLDTTIHKTQDEDKQNKKHNTICVGHCLIYVICVCLHIVVSNTNCGGFFGFFSFFVFVLCLVYGGVQHILCCVFCFVCLRLVSCVWWKQQSVGRHVDSLERVQISCQPVFALTT